MSEFTHGGTAGTSIGFEPHEPVKAALEIKLCETCSRNFTRRVGSRERDCEPCRVRADSAKREAEEQMGRIMGEARRRAELVLGGETLR